MMDDFRVRMRASKASQLEVREVCPHESWIAKSVMTRSRPDDTCSSRIYSSIVSPPPAAVSSSSSPSIARLANFSASSRTSCGTSWCLPFVGPSNELTHDISSSNSLSLLSSCATYIIRAASLTPCSSERFPDDRSSFSNSAFAACRPFPVAAP